MVRNTAPAPRSAGVDPKPRQTFISNEKSISNFVMLALRVVHDVVHTMACTALWSSGSNVHALHFAMPTRIMGGNSADRWRSEALMGPQTRVTG